MRKHLVTILSLFIAGIVLAGGSFSVDVVNKAGTVTTHTSQGAEGLLESIEIVVTGTSTGTVNIATDNEVIYTNTVSATTILRPKFPSHTSTGTQLVGVSNTYSQAYLDYDRLYITLSETAPVTNSYKINFKIRR